MDWDAISGITTILTLLLTITLEWDRLKRVFSINLKSTGKFLLIFISSISFIGVAIWFWGISSSMRLFANARVWGVVGFGGFSFIYVFLIVSDLRHRDYGKLLLAIFGLILSLGMAFSIA